MTDITLSKDIVFQPGLNEDLAATAAGHGRGGRISGRGGLFLGA